jgi:hypothetical protein
VRDFEGLKALARRSGGDAAALNRGACKICGGLGHLTKQCRNFLDGGGQGAGGSGAAAGGAAAAGGGDGGDARALLTEADEALLLGSDSMDSSELGSGSDSDASRGRVRGDACHVRVCACALRVRQVLSVLDAHALTRQPHCCPAHLQKRSRRDKERSSSKRHKKEKSSKRHKKEKSSRKHSKRSHRSRSRSRSRGRDRRDRSRSRSRSRSRDRAQGL